MAASASCLEKLPISAQERAGLCVSLRTAAAGTERKHLCYCKTDPSLPLPSLEELVELSWSLLLALIFSLFFYFLLCSSSSPQGRIPSDES
ncbi:hypothetical protein EK904_002066 [Melospiza melodia maxima]|nr:hypothetical protein EK904_002066 [Melospiza melodia maxima]